MTKSQMFKKAHEIARTTKEIAGSYKIAFACALKDIYRGEATMEQKQNFISYLEGKGVDHWTGKGDRLYISSEIVEEIVNSLGEDVDFIDTFGISRLSKRNILNISCDIFFNCETLKVEAGRRHGVIGKMFEGFVAVVNSKFDCTVNPNAD